MRYDDAVASLFQAPLDQFVAERKRLAGELKAGGDKPGAARLAKLARPPTSAWAVNQLWWHARDDFEALLDTADALRDGKLDATSAHRGAIARLRAHTARILTEAEHGATEATLRKVTQTLAALAAAGGWDPDAPGALSADRDPPGFEAIGVPNLAPLPVELPAPAPAPAPASPRAHTGAVHVRKPATNDNAADEAAAREAAAREAAARAEAAAEARRAEAARARAAAERHRLEAALRTAHGDVAQRERDVTRLERELTTARDLVDQARAAVEDLEERIARLDG